MQFHIKVVTAALEVAREGRVGLRLAREAQTAGARLERVLRLSVALRQTLLVVVVLL